MNYTIKISRDNDDRRLDRFLRTTFKWVTLGEIMRAIRKGEIKINSLRSKKPDTHIYEGDEITIPSRFKQDNVDSEITKKYYDFGRVKIIYQSENVLILNKPAGILVQPDIANGDSIVTRAKDLFNNAFAVHRLDRNTTGVLVVALHGDSLRALEKLFKERSVKKFYIAVVSGEIKNNNAFEINAPLRKYPDDNLVKVDNNEGLPALTKCKKLAGDSEYSLVKLELLTGRTHQARVHMAHVKHPIIGDRKYGIFSDKANKNIKRPLLHAYELEFPEDLHPSIKELNGKIFKAPLPQDIQDFINNRNWKITL